MRENQSGEAKAIGQDTSAKIWSSLVTAGYIDVAGEIQPSFNPKDPNFKLSVPEEYADLKAATPVDEKMINLAKKVLGKMNGKQTLIFLIVATLSLGSYFGFTAYLENTKEIKLAEINNAEHAATLKSMDLNTEKNAENMKLLAGAMALIPHGGEIEARLKAANESLVKAASETKGGIDINGQSLDQKEAKSLVKNKRRGVTEIIVTKDVKILGISRDGTTKITYEDPEDLSVYEVEIKDPILLANHGEALAAAVLAAGNLRIRVLAKDKEGEIIPDAFLGIGDLIPQATTARQ